MKLRASFLWRLYIGYVALIVLLAGLVGVLVTRQLTRSYRDTIQSSLYRDATLLAELGRPYLLGRSPSSSLHQILGELREQIPTQRLTVIGAEGTVLADTHEDPSVMENHADREEVLRAREIGVGEGQRFSRTLGEDQMYLAVAIREGDQVVGFARSSLSMSVIESEISRVRRSVLLAASIATLVALAGGYVFARRITHPLRQMTLAATAITEGDYSQRLYAPSTDEVGSLAQAFNRMAQTLRTHLAEVAEHHTKILAILSSMKEGVIAVDGDEIVVHMNEAAAIMTGVEVADCLHRPHWEVIRLKELGDVLRHTVAAGDGLEGELRLPGPLSDRIIEVQSSVLLDREGHRAGAVVVLHDTSELHRLEGVRQDFVSNVSHEMKTPVAAVRGLVETILADPEMEATTRREFLQRVNQQCHRLSTLVTDLLSLAAAEERQGGAPREPVDVGAALGRSLSTHLAAAEERRLSVENEIAPGRLEVEADEESLRLLFDNLITNAIRYTPRGGRIWVRARAEGSDAMVEIEDTGIGIAPRDQSRIFERFYRVDKARSRELGGTGLGLAIVKHLVRSMDGVIEVRSELGEGSCFRVWIPLRRQAGPS